MTWSQLRENFHYCPETGVFHRTRTCADRPRKGGPLRAQRNGYTVIRIGDKRFFAHRLAWFYVYGSWPSTGLDHINGDPTDNRIANLREATVRQNQWNQKLAVTNTSGYKGVYWHKIARKWIAVFHLPDGKRKHLGSFNRAEDASAAYAEAAKQFYGEFARLW